MVKTSQKSNIENFEQIACFLDTHLAHKKTAFGVGPEHPNWSLIKLILGLYFPQGLLNHFLHIFKFRLKMWGNYENGYMQALHFESKIEYIRNPLFCMNSLQMGLKLC